ncbi:alkaline phosphatase family protein [Flagellimonas sp.]|uniref:alkaline phosphatase family protein n=1 Tax=Flagellimonas sp. TaxID=2058762 RepID=UPI003F49BEF5
MKLFVLGIDAASEEMLRAFDMPFTHKLMDSLEKEDISEDLISRGWVEAYTGLPASRTKGFYEFPLLNNTYDTSLSFNLNIIDKSSSLLWETLNKRNVSVGFMGVPTTFPVPKVDGFFVGGGGGGKSLDSTYNDGTMFYPNEIVDVLMENRYVVDERVPSLLFDKKIFEIEAFFDRLIEMMDRRTQSYIDIYSQRPVQFGFLAYRAVATVAYLSMSEIQRVIDGRPPLDASFSRQLKRFFSSLDKNIEKLFNQIKINDFVLISDHGITVFDSRVNFNFLLQKLGFQSKKATPLGKSLIQKYKHLVPFNLRKKLKKNKLIEVNVKKGLWFEPEKTQAFCRSEGDVAGIFVNDESRFNGPVKDKDVVSKVIEICKAINDSEEAKEHHLRAFPSDEQYQKDTYKHLIPDILISKPLNLKSMTTTTSKFLTKNEWFDKPINLREVKHDNWTGSKKPNALFFFSKSLSGLTSQDDEKNLTLIYKIAERFFK